MKPAVIAGRYALVEPIGRGGMAEVWRGHDHKLDVPVAIKILDPLVGGIAAAERFAREARAAAQIMHPNVVTVLDVGQDGSRRFLVMELLTGRSLAAELDARGPLTVTEACTLLAQAAAGLDAAHRVGVVHRDVKPANLHTTGNGRLKVVDFGLAHVAGEAARLTTVGSIVGTAAYLAPEQIDGSGGQAACDLYALGCVAYEVLCGQPPFTGSPPELVYQHVHQSPRPPSTHRPDIPIELERLILAMLAKNPAERPASAEHVRQVLAAVAHAPRAGAWHAGQPERTAPAPAPVTARAADTAVLDAPLLGPPLAEPPSPEGRRMLVQLAVALAVIVIAALGTVAVFSDSGDRSAVAPPSAAPSNAIRESGHSLPPATATSAAKPARRQTPTPTPTRSTAQGPWSWLAGLDRAVSAQQGRGGIDPKLADRAHKKIREAAKKLAEGKNTEAREKIQELGRDLMEARREGKLADGPLITFLNRSGLTADYDNDDDNEDDDDDD
ncbi:protein kinase domain-containing protein [Nonomuraea sp. H19]|uniref:serine/threonine-protein kinase n=1 Tax=Nonomuraea sp. H19 TaxID=3452206 RepID=UPI003F88E5CE